VFKQVGGALGPLAKRIPDGEVGRPWLSAQRKKIAAMDCFEVGGVRRLHPFLPPNPLYRIKPGVDPEKIRFGDFGYFASAIASYKTFRELRAAGAIPAATRFQVSLPTPFAFAESFFVRESVRAVWPAFERRLFEEIAQIAAAIPHRDLAIQWDVAIEIVLVLEVPGATEQFPLEELAASIARGCDRVPAEAEVGVHLCYGDPGHKHVVEPADCALMVRLAHAIFAAARRPVSWIHMPVPRDRHDDAYFASLAQLRLPPDTELYLGLVHLTDGVEGARRRITAARKVVPRFGVATECGWGRRQPETIAGLLELHRAVASIP
jgi:hypothetical protein